MLKLKHDRAIVETSNNFVHYFNTRGDEHEQRRRFAQTLIRSKFSLCPRGHGASSIRMFETLGVGRVPVIISDEWTPMEEIFEEDCAIVVKDVAQIPRILEEAEPRFNEMSAAATRVFKKSFADDVIFHNIIEKCASLLAEENSLVRPKFSMEYYDVKFKTMCFVARQKGGTIKRNLLKRN